MYARDKIQYETFVATEERKNKFNVVYALAIYYIFSSIIFDMEAFFLISKFCTHKDSF